MAESKNKSSKTEKNIKTSAKKTSTKVQEQTESKVIDPDDQFGLSPIWIRIIGIIFIFILLISLFKFGIIGNGLHDFFQYIFGIYEYLIYAVLISFTGFYIWNLEWPKKTISTYGCILLAIGIYLIFSSPSDHSLQGFTCFTDCLNDRINGGVLGAVVYCLLSTLFDFKGTILLAVVIIIAAVAILLYDYLFNDEGELEIPEGPAYLIEMHKQNVEKREKQKQEQIDRIERLKENLDSSYEDDDDFDLMGDVIIPEPKTVRSSSSSEEDLKSIMKIYDQKEESIQQEEPQTKVHTGNEMGEDLFDDLPKAASAKKRKETEKSTKEKDSQKQKENDDFELQVVELPKNSEVPDYQYPSIELLNRPKSKNDHDSSNRYARESATKLTQTLSEFGVSATITNILVGPAIIKYELKLELGTRVNKISSLQDDIKLALAAKDIRIEAPIPGKSAVGIEIPNIAPKMVTFNEVLSEIPDKYQNEKLLVPLGKDVTGVTVFSKLNEMPHLLIAGATGSGKSVCVNTIICSILMRTKPNEVKLLLVDPKKVELACYDGVPHLLRSVVTDPKKASIALRTVVEEMERRYELFAKYNVRNMARYNEKIKELKAVNSELEDDVIPFIVIILDELADLMMVASKDVEDCIMRITQMARAAGIHLIVATQRPSTDVITGVIKANIPSRIAFAVSSSIDSRTILDTSGAEKLLGKGDMLYSPMGSSSATRLQGAFVSDEEVTRIVDFIKEQKIETSYDTKFENLEVKGNSGYADDEDEEYEDCRDFVIRNQKASASLLQRQFHIGYNKAARIMDQLEANGVIGPQIGSKPREVLIRGYSEEDLY